MRHQNPHLNNARRYALEDARGFSFIEVLLVLGITSILLVVGVINMFGYIGSHNLETETRGIVAMMRDAQSKAMGQDSESRWGVYLINNTGDARDSFSIFQADEILVASSSYTQVPGTVLEQRTMRSNVGFVTPAEGASVAVLFNKISGVPNASTTITVQLTSDPASQKVITVSGNGKIDYQ